MEKTYFDVRSVDEILESNSRTSGSDTYGTRTMILTLLESEEQRNPLRSRYFVALVYCGVFLALLGLLAIWSQSESAILRAGSVAFIVAVAVYAWKIHRSEQEKCQALASRLAEPVRTLEQTHSGLIAYQQELNERTKSYLHLVTHEKVNAFFVLHQLTAALETRIALIKDLISTARRSRIDAARELLQKELSFRDGATADTGTLRRVSLTFINDIADELMHNLNTGLTRIEKELRAQRESLSPSGGDTTGDN